MQGEWDNSTSFGCKRIPSCEWTLASHGYFERSLQSLNPNEEVRVTMGIWGSGECDAAYVNLC